MDPQPITTTPLVLNSHRGVVDRVAFFISGVLGIALGLGLAWFIVAVVTGTIGPANTVQRTSLAVVGAVMVLASVGGGIRAALEAILDAGQIWTVDRNGIQVHERGATGREVTVRIDKPQARSLEFETVRDGDHPEWRFTVQDAAGRTYRYPLGRDRHRASRTHDQVLETLFPRA